MVNSEKILASLIIRTYNEEKKIVNCLKNIFSQQVDFLFEVIIVDSGSTDQTIKLAQEFPVQIITLEKQDFTYGKSLNLGCHKAQGDFLVFISAHAYPANNLWLKNIVAPLDNELIAGVYGSQIPDNNCNPLETRHLISHFKKKGNKKIVQNRSYDFSNTNAAISRKAWNLIKFNEKFKYCEDSDWAKRIMSLGYQIIYEPLALVYHYHNDNLSTIYKRHYQEYYHVLLLENKFFKTRIIINIIYNFIFDLIYLIKNQQKIYWWYRLIANHLISVLAVISSSLKRIIDLVTNPIRHFNFGHIRKDIYKYFNNNYYHWQLPIEVLNFLAQEIKYSNIQKVSIVIPTRNRLTVLKENTLKGLLNQTYNHHDLEIVIADNSDNNLSDSYLNEFKKTSDIKIIAVYNSKPGIGRIINQASTIASGDMLMFTGDDSIIDSGWVERSVKLYNQGQYVLGQGYIYDQVLARNMNPKEVNLDDPETFFVDGNISTLKSVFKYAQMNREIIYGAEGYDLINQMLTFWPNFKYFIDTQPIIHIRAESEYRDKKEEKLNNKGKKINRKMYWFWHINKNILRRNLNIDDRFFSYKFWLKEVTFIPLELLLFMKLDLIILLKTKTKIYRQLQTVRINFKNYHGK